MAILGHHRMKMIVDNAASAMKHISEHAKKMATENQKTEGNETV